MKGFPECVALLGDVVRSRNSDRSRVHGALLAAIDACNDAHPPLDPLRVTVGDEVQGVYATLGQAVAVMLRLRDELLGIAEVRCGLGGGEVQIIDAKRGIQDGSAWWRAREAIERAETLSRQPGNRTSRTALIDTRAVANPLVDPTLRVIDAQLAALSPGSRRSLVHLRAGLDNATAAKLEGVTPSANSQRINDHGLRPLAALIDALTELP